MKAELRELETATAIGHRMQHPGRVRPMELGDIPAVSSLFSKIFRKRDIEPSGDLRQYLEAGAEAVQLATSLMLDPLVGIQILSELSRYHS